MAFAVSSCLFTPRPCSSFQPRRAQGGCPRRRSLAVRASTGRAACVHLGFLRACSGAVHASTVCVFSVHLAYFKSAGAEQSQTPRRWRRCGSSQSSMPGGERGERAPDKNCSAATQVARCRSEMCCACVVHRRTGTYFCVDKSVTAVVIKVRHTMPASSSCMFLCSQLPATAARGVQGLAEHKDELGAPLCPCRHYDDKRLEAEQGFWNCPCVPMRERKVCSLLPPAWVAYEWRPPACKPAMGKFVAAACRSATACCS